MSLYDYKFSQTDTLREAPFYALVMAAMRRADTHNASKLREAFPDTWHELDRRYNAPGGQLPEDAA